MKYPLLALTLLLFCLPIAVTAQRYARVISENANLRDLPNVTSASTLEVPEETLVKILDEKLPWYVVRIGNRVGWMHGDTLEFVIAKALLSRSYCVLETTLTQSLVSFIFPMLDLCRLRDQPSRRPLSATVGPLAPHIIASCSTVFR